MALKPLAWRTAFAVLGILATLAVMAGLLVGCEALRSDSGNANRQNRAESKRRVVAMKEATRQTAEGKRLSGDALTAIVRGKTHVFVYGSSPDGRSGRYVEYEYFRPDGGYVWMNSSWAKDSTGRPEDKWRVDGNRLCILDARYSPLERCFTIAVPPDNRVQYYIDDPGGDANGLLTKVTDQVLEGIPDVK